MSIADFSYAYKGALANGVVRPVLFAAYSWVSRWENSAGAVLEATLGDHDLSRVSEPAAWRSALSPDGGWIPHVLAAADHRLDELRSGRMPDAGGLVLASNQEHAHVLMPKQAATEAVSDFEDRADGLEPTGAFTALEATAEFAHLLASLPDPSQLRAGADQIAVDGEPAGSIGSPVRSLVTGTQQRGFLIGGEQPRQTEEVVVVVAEPGSAGLSRAAGHGATVPCRAGAATRADQGSSVE